MAEIWRHYQAGMVSTEVNGQTRDVPFRDPMLSHALMKAKSMALVEF